MPSDKRQRQRDSRVARLEAERKAATKKAGRRRFLTIAAIVVAVLAGAFLFSLTGDDGGDEEAVAVDASTTTPTDTPNSTSPPIATERDPETPAVEVPEGDLPAELVIDDVEAGDGPEASAGSTLEVDYVGVAAGTGEEFDASFGGDTPFSFVLGSGQVIPGWDQGLEGMKVGGRRRLVIPPDLAYGEAPPGGSGIEPGETLVFVIDLLSVS